MGCRRLQLKNEELQHEIDELNSCYTEMENQLAERINILDNTDTIKDVNYFEWRLQLENMLTTELESFIEDYLKYHNEKGGD